MSFFTLGVPGDGGDATAKLEAVRTAAPLRSTSGNSVAFTARRLASASSIRATARCTSVLFASARVTSRFNSGSLNSVHQSAGAAATGPGSAAAPGYAFGSSMAGRW